MFIFQKAINREITLGEYLFKRANLMLTMTYTIRSLRLRGSSADTFSGIAQQIIIGLGVS